MKRHFESCIKQIDKALERARKLELIHPPKDNFPKPQHDGIPQDGSIEKKQPLKEDSKIGSG